MTIRLRVRRGLRRARSRRAPGARPAAAGWRRARPSAAAAFPRARCPRSSGRRCAPAWCARRRVRTRLPTEDAAAAAASGATRFDGDLAAGGGGSAAGGGDQATATAAERQAAPPRAPDRAPSWRDPAPARRRRGRAGRCAGGVPPEAAGASSSLRMRRIEARMSSIEGSPPAALRALANRRCLRCAHRIRLFSGRAGWSRSRRDRPTCPSPHCSRRSRRTAAPADAGRARSAVRSPRPPDRRR